MFWVILGLFPCRVYYGIKDFEEPSSETPMVIV
jgi:hypothetical protein